MNENFKLSIELIIYLVSIIIISFLAYEQGEYAGMKRLCPNGIIYENQETNNFYCETINTDETSLEGVLLYDNYKI